MSSLNSDELFISIILIAILAYVVTSTVLFIIDIVKSRKEHRKIKVGILVMFIIAMNLAATVAGVCIMLGLLAYAIMTSM